MMNVPTPKQVVLAVTAAVAKVTSVQTLKTLAVQCANYIISIGMALLTYFSQT